MAAIPRDPIRARRRPWNLVKSWGIGKSIRKLNWLAVALEGLGQEEVYLMKMKVHISLCHGGRTA